MKFFLPILLAPAVMGRACKVPHPSVDAAAPVYSVPENTAVESKPVHTTLASHVAAVSKPTEASIKPQAVSKTKKTSSKAKTTTKAKTMTKAKALGDGTSVSGSSTFYGGNLSGGNCMFTTYTLPAGIMGTAFSGQKWDSAANCGACIEVTGPSGTVK